MKNISLNKKIEGTGKSLYYISKHTGIPYTTLNRLFRNKLNVNACSGDVLLRLALFFDCGIEEILNSIQVMSGISGHYHGIKYEWKGTGEETELHIIENGQDHVIDKGKYDQIRFYDVYPIQAENLIDLYLSDQETEAMLNEK